MCFPTFFFHFYLQHEIKNFFVLDSEIIVLLYIKSVVVSDLAGH